MDAKQSLSRLKYYFEPGLERKNGSQIKVTFLFSRLATGYVEPRKKILRGVIWVLARVVCLFVRLCTEGCLYLIGVTNFFLPKSQAILKPLSSALQGKKRRRSPRKYHFTVCPAPSASKSAEARRNTLYFVHVYIYGCSPPSSLSQLMWTDALPFPGQKER